MDRTELSKIIDANISKIYKKYQDANKIETGDISPEDDLKLAVIKKSLANLIMGICDPEEKINILNPVRKRILDQVSNAYSTNFSEHKDLIAFCICSGYLERDDPDTDLDEESDFSELLVAVEKDWLFSFMKESLHLETDEEARKYLQDEYTSDDSIIWYNKALEDKKIVMINFN